MADFERCPQCWFHQAVHTGRRVDMTIEVRKVESVKATGFEV
ncbi:hypothetical protein SacxiDRAFT_0799 [Saccharomonospora xinjiangensis XJ-54]|uniref:Uncharacterized protein n=1 Tax=Saccharomonospora xinjiangensis XJ-54 TaxID=882086 RepID=I0UYW1_9PSEU|nr:hypothetical protein SacxiDRAFT_0799 [Saccharomonospora xinjiangensis XJ-54]